MRIENIGVIFPSSFCDKEKIEKTINFFKNRGLNLIFARNSVKNINNFAGTDEEKISEINEIFSNESVDIVFAFKGGMGLSRIIDKIDYDIIKKSGKSLFGYSDITLLHNAVIKNTGLITYHSPMLDWASKTDDIDLDSLNYLLNFLSNKDNTEFRQELLKDVVVLKNGTARGLTIGGNLALLSDSIGTKADFDTNNKILLIENVGEKIIRVHEELFHLKNAGKFDNIKALIIGGMNYIEEEMGFYSNVNDIILEIFKDKNIPIISNFPFGHDKRKMIIPLNSRIEISTTGNEYRF
ncbi:MAG: LD-carboxypeptidase [Rickettsiales bacterium]|nr:LD-carboxypeptidase [Rickettsiales bacterium]